MLCICIYYRGIMFTLVCYLPNNFFFARLQTKQAPSALRKNIGILVSSLAVFEILEILGLFLLFVCNLLYFYHPPSCRFDKTWHLWWPL